MTKENNNSKPNGKATSAVSTGSANVANGNGKTNVNSSSNGAKNGKRLLSQKAVHVEGKHKPETPSVSSDSVKTVIGVIAFLVFLVVIFVVIKENMPKTQSYETYSYNGFSFTSNGVLWQTYIYDGTKNITYSIQLHNGPKDVENIPFKGNVSDMLKRASGFYLTFNPYDNESMGYIALSAYEISSNYHTVFGKPILAACAQNKSPDCDTRAIINCSDLKTPAIYLVAEGEPEVYVEGPCIYVKGKGEDIVKSANALLYKWYGVIK